MASSEFPMDIDTETETLDAVELVVGVSGVVIGEVTVCAVLEVVPSEFPMDIDTDMEELVAVGFVVRSSTVSASLVEL